MPVSEPELSVDAPAGADKGNGGYERCLNVGSIPVDFRVPRTRSGNFRPRSLPPPYERGYSEEVQAILFDLLGFARSINAAKTALKKMGLGASSEELDSVASGLVEELELVNSRPVDPDLLAIFLDGKYVEVKDTDRLRPAFAFHWKSDILLATPNLSISSGTFWSCLEIHVCSSRLSQT